jgi:hypothetical protein
VLFGECDESAIFFELSFSMFSILFNFFTGEKVLVEVEFKVISFGEIKEAKMVNCLLCLMEKWKMRPHAVCSYKARGDLSEHFSQSRLLADLQHVHGMP